VLPGALEPECRSLYELACNNSKPLWPKIQQVENGKPDSSLVEEFFRLTHLGMQQAQTDIVSSLLDEHKHSDIRPAQLLAYRGIADAIAWQLLRNELAYAKRFFMAEVPPAPTESNIQSVVSVVDNIHKAEPNSIALISDLTSFIQISDIVHMRPNKGMSIYEVKEGSINKEILELLNREHDSQGHYDVSDKKYNSESFRRQLERARRQKNRMSSLQSTLLNDKGTDAATGKKVQIFEPQMHIDSWYTELLEAYEACKSRGWGISVVQNCLYIGCYETGRFAMPAQLAFETWFSALGATQSCPRTSLVDCMLDPLALPIYSIPIPDELKFDLLFGRKHIALGLNVPELIGLCQRQGIQVELASQKATTQALQQGTLLWKLDGRGIVLSNGENQGFLGEGFILRVFFHGEKPIDALSAIANC
jgi:hypothetical protein